MASVKSLLESWLVRHGRIRTSAQASEAYAGLSDQELSSLVQQIHDISDKRDDKLREYKEMLADGVTLSAVELICEDATQIDPDMESSIWISSSDKEFEDEINYFLHDVVNLDETLFSIAFNVVVYGDAYLHTFYSDDRYKSNFIVGEYFELDDSETVAHIYKYGKPCGYYVKDNEHRNSREQMDTILDEKDYIHFISSRITNRERIELLTTNVDSFGDRETEDYTIVYGTSFLEAARTYYKTVKLLEDILLLSRLSRSQFYRMFGIEVGSANTIETERIIKDIKNSISNKQSLDLTNSRLSTYSSPLSTSGNVYYTVRNGKGSVTTSTVGGDTDVRAILDVDWFDDRYFGALKVPKQFLGQSDDLPGGLGDTTLTRLDIRYARTVKNLQKVLKQGARKLVSWYCSQHDIVPPVYQVKMFNIVTADDNEHQASTDASYQRVTDLVSLVQQLSSSMTGTPLEIDNEALVSYVIDQVFKEKNLKNVVKPSSGANASSFGFDMGLAPDTSEVPLEEAPEIDLSGASDDEVEELLDVSQDDIGLTN